MKRTTIPQKIGLVLGGILFALIILELGVRLVRGKLFDTSLLSSSYSLVEKEKQEQAAQYDELLGWVPNYGTRMIRMPTKKGRVPSRAAYTIVEGNIRSNGPGRLKRLGGKTILAVGDSFTFGQAVSDPETWPAHLESLLVNRGVNGALGNYKVINGGVPGYGLDQIVLRSERLVHRYKPDLMIVGFIPDDINRNNFSFRREAKPYFVLEKERLVLKNTPVPLPQGAEKLRDFDLFRRVFGYSHLVDFVMRRVNIYYWLNERITLACRGDRNVVMERNRGVQISCALMKRLAELGDEHHLKVIVLAQYEKSLSEDRRKLMQPVLQCARESGLYVLDLYGPLKEMKAEFPAKFKQLFAIHMTAEGNSFVAQHIDRFIRKYRLLD